MTTNDFDELTPEQTANVFENDDTIRRTLEHIDKYGNPVITGDSDTDELLEDERIAQEEDICPWGEPLHNHHDGCPSCYIADKYGYKTSEDISKGLKKYLQGKKIN